MRYLLVTAVAVMGAMAIFLTARHYAPGAPAPGEAAVALPSATTPVQMPPDQAAPGGSDAARQGLVQRMEQLGETLKTRPKDMATLLDLGGVQLLLGRYAEARATFRRALEVEPVSIPALYGAAGSSELMGDYAEALKLYLDIRKLRLDDPGLDQRIRSVQSALQGAPKQP